MEKLFSCKTALCSPSIGGDVERGVSDVVEPPSCDAVRGDVDRGVSNDVDPPTCDAGSNAEVVESVVDDVEVDAGDVTGGGEADVVVRSCNKIIY